MEKLYQDMNAREKLQLILKYTARVNRATNMKDTLIILADMGRDIVSAERCTIWYKDESEQRLVTEIAHGLDVISVDINRGIVGECVKSGKTMIVDDPYNNDFFDPTVDSHTGFITKSIISEPLFNSNGKVIGCIQVLNKNNETGFFSQEDAELLEVAASFSANCLETLMLSNKIIKVQNETIMFLGELCEKRSSETGRHTTRVSLYCTAIAEEMRLLPEQIQILGQSSALHDIGKLAIPDRILLKTSKLTTDEFEEMKHHTTIGYKMLSMSKNEILLSGAIISNQHHEKYNGKGYPNGLKGDDIDIFARITALADVFDAITSVRCYKDAWNLEKAFELIRSERGEHFDPKVVDAFFRVEDKIVAVYNALKD